MSILADAGLAPGDATNAAHLLNVHILGSVAFQATGADPDTGTAQFGWGLSRLLDGLTTHTTTRNRHH